MKYYLQTPFHPHSYGSAMDLVNELKGLPGVSEVKTDKTGIHFINKLYSVEEMKSFLRTASRPTGFHCFLYTQDGEFLGVC